MLLQIDIFLFLTIIPIAVTTFTFKTPQIVYVSDLHIAASATYTFYIDRTLQNNGNITQWNTSIVSAVSNFSILFPPQYAHSLSTINCQSITVGNIVKTGWTCATNITTNQVIFINPLGQVDEIVQNCSMTFSNVVNPIPGGITNQFIAHVHSDFSQPAGTAVVDIIPATFTHCIASFQNSISNTSGSLTISTQSSTVIPNNTYMMVTLPDKWLRDILQRQISVFSEHPCSSIDHTGIRCTGSTMQGLPTIKIENIFADSYTSWFTIESILTPITNQPTNKIRIELYSSDGRPYYTCDTYPTGVRQRTISSIAVTPLSDPLINTPFPIQISLTIPEYLDLTLDTFQLDLTNNGYSPTLSDVSIVGQTPITYISSTKHTVSFKQNTLSEVGSSFVFNVSSIVTTPVSYQPFQSCSFKVLNNGYVKMKGTFTINVKTMTARILNAPLSCIPECATCEGSIDNCSSCNPTFVFHDNSCLNETPIGYANISGIAVMCTADCQTCQNATDFCLTCSTNYLFQNSCIPQCPDTYYENQIAHECLPCNELQIFCQHCIDQTTCETCDAGRVLFEGQCLSNAPPGHINISGLAVPCTSGCQSCANTVDYCISCSFNYLYNNTCVETCPSRLYPNPTLLQCRTCRELDINCADCLNSTFCLSCDPTFVFFENQCLNYTPDGYANISGIALECAPQCRTCQDSIDTCTSCNYNFLYNNSCMQQCPETYYENSTFLECRPCSELDLPCNLCKNETHCQSCNEGYVLFEQNCIDRIPEGYANVSGVAKLCMDGCTACQSTVYTCTACDADLFLYQQSCISTCPPTQYLSHVGNTCIPCDLPCYTCTNQTNCLSCPVGSNYFYFNLTNQCLQTCPFGYYESIFTQKCEKCLHPCQDCSTMINCVSCVNEFYLSPTQPKCIRQCPTGYIETNLNNTCIPCTSPCTSCEQTRTTCYSCIDTKYYFQWNHTCLDACPAAYATDQVNNKCVQCVDPCISCSGQDCYQCKNPYSLDTVDRSCKIDCPNGYYKGINAVLGSENNFQCLNCPQQCLTCSNSTFCLSCASNYYWVGNRSSGICVNSCPSQTPVLNRQSGICSLCSDLACVVCDRQDICSSCLDNKVPYYTQCLTECPTDYFYSEEKKKCDKVSIKTEAFSVQNSAPIIIGSIGTICTVTLTIAKYFFTLSAISYLFSIGMLSSAWGVPQSLSVGLALDTQQSHLSTQDNSRLLQQNQQFDITVFLYILYSAAGLLMGINLCVLLYSGLKIMKEDEAYLKWRKNANNWQKLMVYFLQFLTLLNFKSQNLLWARFKCSPRLTSVQKLYYLKVATLVGLVPATLALCSIIPIMIFIHQLRLKFIDVLICCILASITSLIALKKQADYFDKIQKQQEIAKMRVRDQYKLGFYNIQLTRQQDTGKRIIYGSTRSAVLETPTANDMSKIQFISDTNRRGEYLLRTDDDNEDKKIRDSNDRLKISQKTNSDNDSNVQNSTSQQKFNVIDEVDPSQSKRIIVRSKESEENYECSVEQVDTDLVIFQMGEEKQREQQSQSRQRYIDYVINKKGKDRIRSPRLVLAQQHDGRNIYDEESLDFQIQSQSSTEILHPLNKPASVSGNLVKINSSHKNNQPGWKTQLKSETNQYKNQLKYIKNNQQSQYPIQSLPDPSTIAFSRSNQHSRSHHINARTKNNQLQQGDLYFQAFNQAQQDTPFSEDSQEEDEKVYLVQMEENGQFIKLTQSQFLKLEEISQGLNSFQKSNEKRKSRNNKSTNKKMQQKGERKGRKKKKGKKIMVKNKKQMVIKYSDYKQLKKQAEMITKQVQMGIKMKRELAKNDDQLKVKSKSKSNKKQILNREPSMKKQTYPIKRQNTEPLSTNHFLHSKTLEKINTNRYT